VGARVGVSVAVGVAVFVGCGVAVGTTRVGASVGVGVARAASHAEMIALPNDAASSLRKSRREIIVRAIVTQAKRVGKMRE
jgi:hypothetical protein